jgi:diketogulonate reductase-like aldo/keto reductase
METKRLNNGVFSPVLGLGTWMLTNEKCIDSVDKAIKLGYRHIDTAEAYGNEKEIGIAIKNSGILRKELFITSKAWFEGTNQNKIIGSCENSLKNLGLDYLDLYLLHWPDKNLNYPDVFKGFKRLYNEGKIKAFGVSNCTINHIKELILISKKLDIPITVNQVEFHPLLYQKDLLEFCKENDIQLTAYSPLARGEIEKNKIIREIAFKYNKTPSQISLRWLIQKGLIVIPKASSEKHLKDNLNVFDFKLKQEDIDIIDNIKEQKRMVDPGFGEFDY